MSLFRKSEKSRYEASARAYKQIQDRMNAVGRGADIEDIRDDVWDLQKKLVEECAKGHTSVAGPLSSAARMSFLIEYGAPDWVRATGAGLGFAAAMGYIDHFFSQRGEPIPRELLHEASGMAMFAAYASHRAEMPQTGIMVSEAITSISLMDRMVSRQSTAILQEDGGLAKLQQLPTTLEQSNPSYQEIRKTTMRARMAGLSVQDAMKQTLAKELAERDQLAGPQGLASSPTVISSIRAVRSSGRTLVYVAPSAASGAALRVNIPGTERDIFESIELPDLDIDVVRARVRQVRNAYAAAQRGELGKKGLAKVVREVLDGVASAFWTPLLSSWPDLRGSRVALVPLGESALLPLYTSLLDGTPACAVMDLTVVPSGRALLLSTTWPLPASQDVFIAADPWYGEGEIPRTVPEAREVAAVHGIEPRVFREPGTVGPGGGLDDSPNAPEQLRALRAERQPLFGSTDAGPAPTDVVKRLSEASLIHLACHGHLRSDEPLTSSLLLGERVPLSSLLERDLLSGTTVVLSACELGSIAGDLPDEQLGFPAAMLAMGARSVIGALWPVPDGDATVALMVDMHRRMADSSATISLGEAIGRAHADGVPSSVWASFTHFGA